MGVLYKGINDLKTYCESIDDFQLIIEWTGHCIDDNKRYNSDEVTKASNKRFEWQCIRDSSHVWDATVASRTHNGTGCPYCNKISKHNKSSKYNKGIEIQKDNSLNKWCLDNGERGKQIFKEWTGYCIDDDKQYSIDEIDSNSNKKFRWKCTKNVSHVWETKIASRTKSKTGCPYCAKINILRTLNKHSLATWCNDNNDIGSDLIKEWTGHCTDSDVQYDTSEVAMGSRKRFEWRCKNDASHIWIDTIYNRVYKKTKCPYCNNHKHKNIH